MVAIPIAFDQPGISARIARHGVGEFVNLDNLSADNLLSLIRNVLTNRSYAERAHYFKEVIARTRGLDTAADVIEQAFQKASNGEIENSPNSVYAQSPGRCAGINRHEAGNGRVLRERSSEPLGPEFCVVHREVCGEA
jgi:hypothetical protein